MTTTLIKKGSTLYLRAVIYAIGIIVLAFCLFSFPHFLSSVAREFPRAGYEIPLSFISLYGSALPFFFALFQSLKLLDYIDRNNAFSGAAVKSLKYIKYSGFTMTLFYLANMPLVAHWAQMDDAPGLVVIGFAFAMSPSVVGVFAAVMQQLLQNAIDIKNENDLTV